jgi:chromosome partitioning protein
MLAGVIPTLYEKRNRQDNKILQAIRQQLGQVTSVFEPIPKAVAFPEASQAHLPLAQYQKSHRAVDTLIYLTQTVLSWQNHLPQSQYSYVSA